MDLSGYTLSTVHQDSDFVLSRGRAVASGTRHPPAVLVRVPASEHPGLDRVRMLEHELSLRDELDPAWAVRPLTLGHLDGRTALILEDQPGELLDQLVASPPVGTAPAGKRPGERGMEASLFLRLAIGLSAAIGEVHRRGIIHKNVKPASVLANVATSQVWLTGFGIASKLPRERLAPGPPEMIAGTLAYIAPEQTGCMNRSVDARSDLYALGVTLYEMLTGVLPFTAADPMEWVHCHVARQAKPPSERLGNVPAPLSAIVMKLLAKTAEERYQTAGGLERDLRRCLVHWEADAHIDDFPLGQDDTPDRLLIPEKLYGREPEIQSLLAAFDRIVQGSAPELVLVSGYSGIGKSTFVNELHKVLVPPRGLFAAGKFDQYKRDIPYATLAQALQGLIHTLLAKSDVELRHWREAIHEAVGPNGRLMIDLVPELRLVIGEQPPVPELPPQDTQRRFQAVFRRFLGVFARSEHPLAVFLDDLQWLDAATIDLLEDLLTQADVRHLLLIGAYRDNEVPSSHPLMRTLDRIRAAGTHVREIVLAPLVHEHVSQLISDSLHCDGERADALAALVHEKTAGNPFFVIQFLAALVEEELLTFDHATARWKFDLARIHAKGYTDNVVDLMVGMLSRLPPDAQKALQHLSYLGNRADFALIERVHADSAQDLHDNLQEALRTGLVVCMDGSYRFLHDRVQEAAYSLTPENRRAEAHLKIGMSMASSTPAANLEEVIFEVVSQINRGLHLLTSVTERERVAELNLIAGRRAKASTAYASALKYLHAGRGLLTDETWSHNRDLVFSLECLLAECELLTADATAAETRLSMLASRVASSHEIALVTCLRLTLYTALDRGDRAVEVFLEYWKTRGTVWSPHPAEEDVLREYRKIGSLLGDRQIEELVDLPLMTDADALDVLDVLNATVDPAAFTDIGLFSMVICRMVALSLEHGNGDGSCCAYLFFGVLSGHHFGNYQAGFRFGKLGYDLVEQRGLHRYRARTTMCFGTLIIFWTKHIKEARDLLRRSFDDANRTGDLAYAAYCCNTLNTNLLAAGDPLAEVQREAESGLEFATSIRFGFVVDKITAQIRLVRTLRGLTNKFGTFDDEGFEEQNFERHLASEPALALPECWYWIRKLQARLLAGDYPAAIEASINAQRLLWTSPGFFETAEYHFYSALARAAAIDFAAGDSRRWHMEALNAHQRQHEIWAQHCPENFENRRLLIDAEIARVEGRELDAERLYEGAIRSARENGFAHNEALANEHAARFHAARGFPTIGDAYLRNARHGYVRWGAEGKVREIDQRHPHLRPAEVATPIGTITAPVEHLDLATVITVSQAVSGEMVLEKLLDTLMRIAVEHAGAERAVLVLFQGAEQRIASEAVTRNDAVMVRVCDDPVSGAMLPQAVLQYVLHTRNNVILDDAAIVNPFSADPYIGRARARSVLCLPLTNQTKAIGALYLENNLAPGVFVPARAALLKLLACQAAISLENSHLYRDLAEREARIRRLVDANIIGIFIWELEGPILEANDAFLTMVGYDRADLVAAGLRWTDLTPPEWRDGDERRMPELKTSGILQPFEKEFFRRDGSRLPVLVGVASFEGTGNQGVAYVVDLTERKLAEEALARAKTELAHVSRLTTLSAFAASIGHEINQPLSGIMTNAATCLRMLDANPPNIDGARRTAQRTIRDGTRASEVIVRLRALFSKREFTLERVDLNEAVGEVVALSLSDLKRSGIALEAELADGLPPVPGDRIQLQQVVLNLLRNASDAMAEVRDRPRQLRITTQREDGGRVRVSVRDAGVGLSAQNIDSLFEPFYTTKSGGMGIGLFVSRSIVERHHGRVWAEPNQGCPGATFSFSIPHEAPLPGF